MYALKSQWFISSDVTLADIYNHLINFVDDDDYLFINEANIHCRGHLPREVAEWLNAKF